MEEYIFPSYSIGFDLISFILKRVERDYVKHIRRLNELL